MTIRQLSMLVALIYPISVSGTILEVQLLLTNAETTNERSFANGPEPAPDNGTVTDPLIGGEPVDGLEGWYLSEWFGYYSTALAPWLFHADHDYVYRHPESTGAGMFFFDNWMGTWWWTNESEYPFIYVFDPPADSSGVDIESNWLYYFVGTRDPRAFGVVTGASAGGFLFFGQVPVPEGYALIDAGSFTMGSPPGEVGKGIDEAQYDVTLTRSFRLTKTEVTWSQWNAVRADATQMGYTDIATGRNGSDDDVSGHHPVTEVSWWDAIKWCNLQSEIEEKTPVYYTSSDFGSGNVLRTGTPTPYADFDADGYRLPTEAEWEYACRAGSTTPYNGDSLDTVGWHAGNSGGSTHPVAEKTPNDWDLFDMHGNVWEWCWDWYASYPDGSATDPVGPRSKISSRMRRGGHWNLSRVGCRSADRDYFKPNYRLNIMGFRVAFTVVP